MLTLKSFPLGQWMTNCYVLHPTHAAAGSPCWIFDAGYDPQPIISYIAAQRLQPQQVLLTHAHLDHIAGLRDLRQAWPELPILIHGAERDFLTDPDLNLSTVLDEPVIAPAATGELTHGQILDLAGVPCEVRHTPGHSPGGVTFYLAKLATAIVGDTLFARSIGRFDFPTSDGPALLQSIREQLLTLPDQTKVYPGHGPATTIARERAANPYVLEMLKA